MTPVIIHLRSLFSEFPLLSEESRYWTFDEKIKNLGPDFYSKFVSLHPVLNLEYSILCHQIRHNFSHPQQVSHDQVIEQLTSALMIAQLLEYTALHYLIVPREVVRLRRQQRVYMELLAEMADYTFSTKLFNPDSPVDAGLSLTQRIREHTAQINWYRLLITRSKRVLNFLDLVGTGSETYRNFIGFLDKYTNPFFAYLAWCFFIPRLSTNIFLIFKHTIPWPWMDDKEKSLHWLIRFEAQIKRRWFELGNDIVWVALGLANCFILTGALAPFSIYFTLFAFAFDVANSSLRTFIELDRLNNLQKYYAELYKQSDNEATRKSIKEYQHFLSNRINFEKLRLGLHLAGTIAIFLAMSLAIPALAINPVVPLIGAILLIIVWGATFTLTRTLEQYRPNDNVEKPSNVAQIGFFSRKNTMVQQTEELDLQVNDVEDPDRNNSLISHN